MSTPEQPPQRPQVAGGLSQATKALHEQLIRLAKGAISAWEKWLSQH